MPKTVSLPLKGLDCANCAAKIEDALVRAGLPEAKISFATGQIHLPADQVDLAQQVISQVDEGVIILRPEPADGAETLSTADESDDDEGEMSQGRIWELTAAGVLLVVGSVFHGSLHATPYAAAEYAILLTAYFLVGRQVLAAALRNTLRGQLFDENFLMTIATVGAIAIHQLPEAVAVMLFYSVGEYFQDLAVARNRRSIRALMAVRPDHANVMRDGKLLQVSPEEVAVGETILVRPGERVPLDGEIIEGATFVDTSALTGESVPRRAEMGDTVLAGSVNTRGLITMRVSRPFGESSIARIMQMVEEAAAHKAPTERMITKFARYYTPAVVLAAACLALIPPLVVPGSSFSDWLYRALVLLVISCPCALVVSVPLSYFSGIGAASRHGVLVKGGNYLDALAKLGTVVWDKTGTLTQGVFRVAEVVTFGDFTPDQVLELAAHGEAHASHPIAASILGAYGRPVREDLVSDYEEVAGQGVRARIGGVPVLVGSSRLLEQAGIACPEASGAQGTVVLVASDGRLAGRIIIADEIKAEAAAAVRTLRSLGVRHQVMLTGDDQAVAEQVGQRLGLDQVRANLLPEHKVAELERIHAEQKGQGALAFVGDGINDAPVLTRADVGIAMGALGSDAAIEAADVVVMDDNPVRLADAVRVARRTQSIVYQNIAFALGVKFLAMVLGALGSINMWAAVFADVGVTLLAIMNAARLQQLAVGQAEHEAA